MKQKQLAMLPDKTINWFKEREVGMLEKHFFGEEIAKIFPGSSAGQMGIL